MRVPKHTIRGHAVKLECHYDMEGEALYSVKWYKDGREFYRFVPRDDPPGSVFPQPGIAVDVSIQPEALGSKSKHSTCLQFVCVTQVHYLTGNVTRMKCIILPNIIVKHYF